MPSNAELTKLRRWALELLAPNAPIDTVADIEQICRASDALIEYMLTGTHPQPTPETRDGKDGKDGSGDPPTSGVLPN